MEPPATGPQVIRVSAVRNDDEARYEGRVDGELVATVDFVLRGDTVLVTHTGTKMEWRGRGIAAQLTTWALDDIRAQGRRLSPLCPYTARFIDSHPGYEDLLA